MSYKYNIPNSDGTAAIVETDSQVVVIVGANGSGKSKLGAWIEQQDPLAVHRIAAQRSLSFNENLTLKSYAQAEDMVMYGTLDERQKKSKCGRWDWGKSYTTKLINDFEDVLAALLALKNDENDKFVAVCKEAEVRGVERPATPITSVDKLQKVWRDVYPQRDLVVEDSKFLAEFVKDEKTVRYCANEMSDGERAVLYFAAQILCVPKNRTLIIDEPEVHLHRSIINRLWRSLMALRKDCLFIIITHDIDFASSIGTEEKYWIKSFDGQIWDIQKIRDSDIPEKLLLEVMGSRKNILLVEGSADSYDTRLYSSFYDDWHVIPCGGCDNVISCVKAFSRLPELHSCNIRGIVDRDYRCQEEIDALMDDGVYVLPVAEVENLFLVPELLEVVASQFASDDDSISKVEDYIVDTKFRGMMNGQIRNKFLRELKYAFESLDLSDIDIAKGDDHLLDKIHGLDAGKLLQEIRDGYVIALDRKDYAEILKIFNAKELVRGVGGFFGIASGNYCEKILRFLSDGEIAGRIKTALGKYLPTLE